jgi:hypothetical protein
MAAAEGCRFASVRGAIPSSICVFEFTEHARDARRYRLMTLKQ